MKISFHTDAFNTSFVSFDRCLEWARAPRGRLLEFVNTQIVTMRRHDPAFRNLMNAYEDLVPDGMPLVWCLN